MPCKIHTPATKLQIEFNQAAILGRRDWKFIRPPTPLPPPKKKKKSRMEKILRLGFCAVSSLIDLAGGWGLLFHSILSKIVVDITLGFTGCKEKKLVPVNDL